MAKKPAGFARNTATLASGNIASQLLSIALVPVITRLYSTEQFGEFSIVAAIAMTLFPISSLRYHAAILLPERAVDGRALVRTALLVNACLTLLLVIIVYYYGSVLAEAVGLAEDGLMAMLPVLFLLGGWHLIIDAWALRNERFWAISFAGIGMTLADRTVGIVAGAFSGLGSIGLLLGRATGLLANSGILLEGLRRIARKKETASPTIADMRRVAVEFKSFAIYSWSALIQQASRQAPIFLLGALYSSTIAGLYALTFRILAEPVHIVGTALGKSFAHRAAKEHRATGDISRITFTLFKYLLLLITVPMTVLAVIAPSAFGLIFGPDWEQSGVFVQYVAPVFILTFIFRSFAALFDVLRKQKEQMFFGVTMLVTTLGSFSIGVLGYSVDHVLIAYATVTTIVVGSRIVWLLSQAGVSVRLAIGIFVKIGIHAALFGLLAHILMQAFSGDGLTVLLSSALLIVGYFSYVVVSDKEIRNHLYSTIRK